MNLLLREIPIEMETLDFGSKLIEVRKAKGLTQKDVAEKCNITIRTIQRIESGVVTPRASTIKIIAEHLEFDFFLTSNTGVDVDDQSATPQLELKTPLWYFKDLFNLKTNTMKKVTILSTSLFLAVFTCVSIFNTMVHAKNPKQKSLTIDLNEDGSIKRVETAFTGGLNIDSLVRIKKELEDIGIIIHYRKIEFNVCNLLTSIACEVICNDGYSGAVINTSVGDPKDVRFGFYRDYAPDAKSPFGTGALDYRPR